MRVQATGQVWRLDPAPECKDVIGWLGDALKVKIHAPPVEGRANEALCEFLADTLGVPARAVTVLRGDTSTRKIIHIAGLTPEAVKARLNVIAP